MPLPGIGKPCTGRDLITNPDMAGLKDGPESSILDRAAVHPVESDTKMSKKSKRALKKKQKAALKQPPQRRGELLNEEEAKQPTITFQWSVDGEEAEHLDQHGNFGYSTRISHKARLRETRPRGSIARYVLDWVNAFKRCSLNMTTMARAEKATDIVGVMGTARGRPFQTRFFEYSEPTCNTGEDQSNVDNTLKDDLYHEIGDSNALKDDSGVQTSFDLSLKYSSGFEASHDGSLKHKSGSQISFDASFNDDSGSETSYDSSPKDNSGSETSYDEASDHESHHGSPGDKAAEHQTKPSLDSIDTFPSCGSGPTEKALQYMKNALELWASLKGRWQAEEEQHIQPDLGAVDTDPPCGSGPTERALQCLKSAAELWAKLQGHWRSEPTPQSSEAQDDLLDSEQPGQLVMGHFHLDAPRPDLRGLEWPWLSAAPRKFGRKQLSETQSEDLESDSKERVQLSLAEDNQTAYRSIFGPYFGPFATRLDILPPQVTVLTVEFPDLTAGFPDLTAGLYDPFVPVGTTQPQDDTQPAASDDNKLPNEQKSNLQSDISAPSSTSALHLDESTKLNTDEPDRNLKRRHTPMISRESNRPKKLKGKEVKVFVLREKPA